MDADDSNQLPGSAAGDPDTVLIKDVGTPAGLREDQIQNAVAFLSHPKVRDSPVPAKRSFLEKKGLTSAEIDEAFKRVPETQAAAAAAAPMGSATAATPTYGANNLVTYTQQPTSIVPAGQVPAPAAQAGALVPMQQHMAAPPQPLRWTQVVLGLGVAAASLYGLHQLLAPRVSHWASQLTASRRAAQEAEAARTAALTAALESLAQGQKQLLDSIEGLTAAVQQQQQQQQRPGSSQQAQRLGLYGIGATETSSISFAGGTQAEYLRCQSPGVAMVPPARQGYSYAPNSVDSTARDAASRAAAVRGWDPYADPARGRAIRSAGYGSDGSSFLQQAEAAGSSVVGVAAGPADGFEVVPRSMQAARPVMRVTTSSSSPPAGQQQAPDEAPHSAAFHEVMEMVRQGITPPNVRTDINDTPPDPSRPISAPQLAPRGKPWERSSASSTKAAQFSSSPPAAVADNFMQRQHYGNGIASIGVAYSSSSTTAAELPSASSRGSQLMSSMEATAAEARRQSLEGTVGRHLSHLLGHDPGSTDAPWRPPPPPEPTVLRPNSSGSTSSRTGTVPATGSGEDVVASVAASAVQNVVAAAEAEASALVAQAAA